MIFENDDLLILQTRSVQDFKIDESNISSYAYRGDKLIIKYGISNKKPYPIDINIRTSDFLSNNLTIKQDRLEVRTIKKVRGHIGRSFSKDGDKNFPKIEAFDLIEYENSLRLEGESINYFYLYITTSLEDKGVYKGSLFIDYLNKSLKVDLSFEILPIDKTRADFDLNLWQYPYSEARYYEISDENFFKEDHKEILSEVFNLYKAYRGDTLTTSIIDEPWDHQTYDPYPSMVRISHEDLSFNYEHFDSYVNLGIDKFKKIYAFSLIPWDKEGFDRDFWHKFLRDFIAHLDSKNLFDRTYIAIDERKVGQVKEALDFLQPYKNKDGKSFKVAYQTSFDKKNISLYNKVDEISFDLPSINYDCLSYVKERKEVGLYTSLYICCGIYPNTFIYSDSYEAIFVIIYAYLNGFDGFLRWALDAYVKDPRSDLSFYYFESGDTSLIYPSKDIKKDKRPASSVRLESLAEGLEIIDKIDFLKKNLKEKDRQDFISQFGAFTIPESFENEYKARISDDRARSMIIKDVTAMKELIYKYSKIYLEGRRWV